jgi:hypothetical protein
MSFPPAPMAEGGRRIRIYVKLCQKNKGLRQGRDGLPDTTRKKCSISVTVIKIRLQSLRTGAPHLSHPALQCLQLSFRSGPVHPGCGTHAKRISTMPSRLDASAPHARGREERFASSRAGIPLLPLHPAARQGIWRRPARKKSGRGIPARRVPVPVRSG